MTDLETELRLIRERAPDVVRVGDVSARAIFSIGWLVSLARAQGGDSEADRFKKWLLGGDLS